MPAARRHIDPMTGDYELESGAPRASDGIAGSVVLALRMHRGSSAVAPTLGSRLHTIRKLTSNAPTLAEQYALEAIQHLVAQGKIRSPKAKAVAEGTALSLELTYVDRQGFEQAVRFTRRIG